MKRKSLILVACLTVAVTAPAQSGGGVSHGPWPFGTGGAATNLTPWPSDINAAGHSLTNAVNIEAKTFSGDGQGLWSTDTSPAPTNLTSAAVVTGLIGSFSNNPSPAYHVPLCPQPNLAKVSTNQSFPVLAASPNGSVIGRVWRESASHAGTNSVLFYDQSTNGGFSWTTRTTVVSNTANLDYRNQDYGWLDSTRQIVIALPYNWTNVADSAQGAVLQSSDNGATWSQIGLVPTNQFLLAGSAGYGGFGPIRKCGNEYLAGWYEANSGVTIGISWCLRSSDGTNWTAYEISSNTQTNRGEIEPQLIPLNNSEVLAFCRSSQGFDVYYSTNQGISWVTNGNFSLTGLTAGNPTPPALGIYQGPTYRELAMAVGVRNSDGGALEFTHAPIGRVLENPSVLTNVPGYYNNSGFSNFWNLGPIATSGISADGGYASMVNLDNSGNFLISYYFAVDSTATNSYLILTNSASLLNVSSVDTATSGTNFASSYRSLTFNGGYGFGSTFGQFGWYMYNSGSQYWTEARYNGYSSDTNRGFRIMNANGGAVPFEVPEDGTTRMAGDAYVGGHLIFMNTNAAPGDTTTPKIWVTVSNSISGQTYQIPLYQ